MENTHDILDLNQTVATTNAAGLPTAMRYTQKETFIKKTSTGALRLTNYRLIWKDSDTIIVLPVDAITFIGYKKQRNWLMLIFGILLLMSSLVGIYLSVLGRGNNSEATFVNLLVLLVGVALIAFSLKKFIVFATSGGEILINTNSLEHLNEWIDAVSAEREQLKRGV